MNEYVVKFIAAGLAATALSVLAVGCGGPEAMDPSTVPPVIQTEQTSEPATVPTLPPETTEPEQTLPPIDPERMDQALFIGDSRTVGMMEYSELESDFFAGVGMTVYNVLDETVSVPDVGKVTLEQLLSNKSYDKIYLMLGINELGYDMDQTVDVYEELLDFLRELQPEARIFVQANMHVTQAKSDAHSYINNSGIDAFNDKISKFADGKTVFYLDVNPVYDDENGALSEDVTSDGVHLYAKYYVEWGDWIAGKSADLIKEG